MQLAMNSWEIPASIEADPEVHTRRHEPESLSLGEALSVWSESMDADPEVHTSDHEQESPGFTEDEKGAQHIWSEVDNGVEINITSIEELRLQHAEITSAQDCWVWFVGSARENASDAIYAAIYEADATLQPLFVTPRRIQAMKFLDALGQLVGELSEPSSLMITAETYGFVHLALEVTVPRFILVRDAILDLFQVELGERFTTNAYSGWRALLNYVGGAIIYIRSSYSSRILLLDSSWKLAKRKQTDREQLPTTSIKAKSVSKNKRWKKSDADADDTKRASDNWIQKVQTSFNSMFLFNAAVMGLASRTWMHEVLSCFDDIVSSVADPQSFTGECEVLVFRVARITDKVNFSDFKSCMLASLRSLLPMCWTTAHEVAWSWLCESVERTLKNRLSMTRLWERAVAVLLDGMDEATSFRLRQDIFLRFFASAPAAEGYFRRSNAYLRLIATSILVKILDMYREPVRTLDDISAVGLRHVGYGIPTELVPKFASACVDAVQALTADQLCIDGFQWSIGLISKRLVRTIRDGSTLVMKAINVNTQAALRTALSVAPRAERSTWMLLVQVGTQSISPLMWSIESGARESASAMIKDLLTFRADREKYYYAANDLFYRHPTMVSLLLSEAPELLPELLDGLVWRSQSTFDGKRRVNYYVRHILVDHEGNLAKTFAWVAKAHDVGIVCHPVLVFIADLVWSRVASYSFLLRMAWSVVILALFTFSRSVGRRWRDGDSRTWMQCMTFACSVFVYIFSLGRMLWCHTKQMFGAYCRGETFRACGVVSTPSYLANSQQFVSFVLMCILLVVLATEPVLYCLGGDGALLTDSCEKSAPIEHIYSQSSMVATFLYTCFLVDLAVFHNRLLSYVLVCGRLLNELVLFLLALAMTIFSFSSSLPCLDQTLEDFQSTPRGARTLLEVVVGAFSADVYSLRAEPIVLICVYAFWLIVTCLLTNLLLAQMCSGYASLASHMTGYARLKRIRIIAESSPFPQRRWERFVTSLDFERCIEFNDGDVGVNNGIATMEPATDHPTAVDRIKRFGGSTSPAAAWPEDKVENKFDRLESRLKRILARVTKNEGKRRASEFSSKSSRSGAPSLCSDTINNPSELEVEGDRAAAEGSFDYHDRAEAEAEA